jgi:MFS transporter, DHA3 family, macrolide efflux protein
MTSSSPTSPILQEGWAFLRTEATLLANTIQGTAAQFAVGVVTALGFLIADELTPGSSTATYAFLEVAIGVGNLIGGFLLGLLASRVAKGRLIIAAYTAFGVLVMAVGLIPPLPVTIGLMVGIGVANMAFVIPSQTMFQERTPPELMGRVVSFRFAIVFGGMTIAVALLGFAANVTGIGPVIVVSGLISVGAGLAGLLYPAVRDAP